MEWFWWCFFERIQVQYWHHFRQDELDGDGEEQQGNCKGVHS